MMLIGTLNYPQDFSKRAPFVSTVPLYMRLQEHHCISPQVPLPCGGEHDGFDDGLFNAYFPRIRFAQNDVRSLVIVPPPFVFVILMHLCRASSTPKTSLTKSMPTKRTSRASPTRTTRPHVMRVYNVSPKKNESLVLILLESPPPRRRRRYPHPHPRLNTIPWISVRTTSTSLSRALAVGFKISSSLVP
jgi:hypothetical protein